MSAPVTMRPIQKRYIPKRKAKASSTQYVRRATAVKGRGDYCITGPFDAPLRLRPGESVYRTPFADTAGTIGSYIGPRAARIARGIGSAIGGVFGSGDYKIAQHNVKSNTLLSNTTIPGFTQSNALIDGIHVTHREYITDI